MTKTWERKIIESFEIPSPQDFKLKADLESFYWNQAYNSIEQNKLSINISSCVQKKMFITETTLILRL